MSERSSQGKKSKAPAMLDFMDDAPAPSAQEEHTALFGGEEVDLTAKHPADVPVGNFPAPSQIALADPPAAPEGAAETTTDPFAEEDPFAESAMARMLADEPAPLVAAMRAAREELFEEILTEPADQAPPEAEAAAEEAAAAVPPVMAETAVEPATTKPAMTETEQKEELSMSSAPAAPQTKTAPAKTKQTPPKGLKITRRYTEPGGNVWNTVEWEHRTASIVGSDGTVVFEQKGVEIPKDWSQLATNVVVSKYFRGQIGTLEREYSVKQLIGRVADRILEWGQQGSYFATDEDAEAFHDELRYILLHQMAAFNSPVWFNLGWAGRRQAVSACYINEVNDTMESILDLYKTEGLLFKDGSGCTSGDSLVYVRDAGFLPIRNLYKKFFAEGRPVQEFDSKGRYIEVDDAEVYTLSIDPDTGAFGMDQVLRVWQYDLPQEDKLTVRLDTGAKATVSCWHPFLVWDGEKITHRRADALRRGDAVLGPNETAQAAVPRQQATFEYESSYFGRQEKQVVALDEDLAWLCGYFMGDGSLGAKKSHVTTTSGRRHTYDTVRLRFYDETLETLQRVQSIITRVFGEECQISRGQCCPMLTYNGRHVTRFFEQLFGVGSKTYSLSMPAFVWNSPRAIQLAFLAGLVDSDGYVAEGGRAKYSSASHDFAGQVAALASFLGLGGGVVSDAHVTTTGVLHRVATMPQREEFAAHLAHPERRRRLLEICSDKPQRKFCLPLSEALAHDLFGADRAPADWLAVPVGNETLHLGRLKYGGLINPLKLQKALHLLNRDDETTRLLSHVAESVSFVFSVEPCADDPDFYDLTVRDHNNYLAGENGLTVIHNSGVNLSVLRSSKEPLAAGGKSSGPISFMKGLDASAGSIKSGGSTRRAACMRVLDIDHPDVADFINCKKDAEEKAHALIDAGYSGAFNVVNGAYDTVPFQNANHSVRVTDDFMQAVESGAEWQTIYRQSGKPATTAKARDLMRSIAEATWVCGDPGMQYDTTINDWHTCSNTDRIYASNPCVTGDTLVATADGWQRIDALVGQSTRVIGADGQPHFVEHIFPTGHKPVFRLRTRAGFELTLTENHPVLTVGRGDVEVKDICIGDQIYLAGAGFGRRTMDETLALAVGLAVGDGCLIRQTIRGREQEYVVLTMAEAESAILETVAATLNQQKALLRAAGISGNPSNTSVSVGLTPGTARLAVGSASVVALFTEFATLGEGSAAKCFTPAVYDLDKPALAAVLRGLFTADGTVANYGDKSQYVALDSISLNLLQQVQTLLLSFGIKAKLYTDRRGGKVETLLPGSDRQPKLYAVKEVHSLRISRSSRMLFEREIGFDPASPKAARLHEMNLAFLPYADSMTDEIVSITPTGDADVFDLTEPVTSHFVGNGIVVHNCSEYMFLNSTACNLSSLNLMKFRTEDGGFDVKSFEHAVQIMITGQEIVVGFAAYPTPKIEERSHVYRTLGLGYANLGALLMAAGLPYDSNAGRAYAGAVTAIMTGRAYHQSAAIARDCGGPFAGYAENREPMLRVMRKHREQVDEINPNLIPASLLNAAREAWDDTLTLGELHGFRNAQSTVLAPTGTIGFLMDCDTTGIEPDIAIVKYKSLVGGGMMKIVNQTVPEALQRLGYSEDESEAIIRFIDENDTIEGAPGLKTEHLPIFDCAFRPMNGTRSIHHMGHIKMMAAAQPFISGAISKTVNVPTDADPETIADTYLQAWKLGLKAVAIYRDGSKRTQPLNTSKETPAGEKSPTPVSGGLENAVPVAMRRRLPDERASITHKFSIGGHEGYLTVGLYPDTQQPGEIFIRMAKEGSSISGLMDSFATAISLALQYGVPLSTLVDKFIHSRFEPSGFTGNKDIPMAKSVMDYIFRYLALRFLQKEERHNVGLLADQEGYGDAAPAPPAPKVLPVLDPHDAKNGTLSSGRKNGASDNSHLADNATAAITDHEHDIYRMQSDAPPCPECGAITIRSGACYKCVSCGTSLGCS